MLVSIITVSYNSENTIERCIESVSTQTYAEIEYIIIDGCSTDNTVEIIKRYEGKIKKWISEPDGGLYDAMNKGIQLSTGDLIGILNSDDFFFSNTIIEDVVNFHNENSIEASIGNIVQMNSKGKILRKYSSKNWTPYKLKIGFMPPHPSIFFKKELFYKYGNYSLGFKIGADYELIIRFFLKHNLDWKYSNITTTAMLVGGVSSSGIESYNIITKEIQKALVFNDISFKPFLIQLRFFWKLFGFIKK